MPAEELFFEDVEVGDTVGPQETVITTERVRSFLNHTSRGGAEPMGRFLYDEAARAEGIPGAVLPANMTVVLLSQFLTDWSPGVTLKKLDVVFRQWVLHNTPVHFQAIITAKDQGEDEGDLECDVFIQTPGGERLVFSKAVISLPLRDAYHSRPRRS